MEQQEQHSAQQQQAIALSNDEGWTEAVRIARGLVADFERQALECEDEKECVRLHGEAKGARKFLAQLSTHSVPQVLQAQQAPPKRRRVRVARGFHDFNWNKSRR
jgi:hypothetical protein